MTHQEFIEEATEHYYNSLNNVTWKQIVIMMSVKTANNSKLLISDLNPDNNYMCEATLIGSKNLIVYDFYKRRAHEEVNF